VLRTRGDSVKRQLRFSVDRVNLARALRLSHDAVIRAYDDAGNVIETHEHKGEFKEP
jgi:hypothetical protein